MSDGLTTIQQALVDRARSDGQPLDLGDRDDAAVLLRAETLVRGGASGGRAIAQARQELLVYCATCAKRKRFATRTDLPGLAFPACGHQPVHVEPAESVTFEALLGQGEPPRGA